MKLYRCRTPTDHLCPCGRVARELRDAGLDYETERVPLSSSPKHREEIMRLTGQPKVPVLVDEDGTALHDSKQIIERIRNGRPRHEPEPPLAA